MREQVTNRVGGCLICSLRYTVETLDIHATKSYNGGPKEVSGRHELRRCHLTLESVLLAKTAPYAFKANNTGAW